jgi:pimeloyl-ACP methyl ester carboxylesterase
LRAACNNFFIFCMTMTSVQAQPATATPSAAQSAVEIRQTFKLTEPGSPQLALQWQRTASQPTVVTTHSSIDVVYVHGATFGADLSVFYRMDGRSWADELNAAGWNVWGFDFAGYGGSDAYASSFIGPAGRMNEAVTQLRRVIEAVRQKNGDKPVLLLGHSWGASVAAMYAGKNPQDVRALLLFAPVVARTPSVATVAATPVSVAATPPAVYPLSLWSQYRRFIDDVPRGQPQVLSEAHFQSWGTAYLSSDARSGERMSAAVLTPFGPIADIGALWSSEALYDPALVTAPTLLIRGAWDSLCTDADAAKLVSQLSSTDKTDIKVERATHLMHLESGRAELHRHVNAFLNRVSK